jgi:signal transduction histidine kinase
MATPGSGLRILIVEDNELDARSMMKSLTASRDDAFQIVRVADLASGVDLLERSHFDCILLDLSLPDSVGLVSVDVLLEQAPGCPIVVLTGLDDPDTALEAVERGAQDYLSKGRVDGEGLSRAIRYAVARQHSEMALRRANAQLDLLRDRERIARDLHDTVIQQLFATGLGLESTAASIADHDTRRRVQRAVEAIDGSIGQLREAIFGLHAIPEELALAQAIAELAEEKAAALGFDPIVEVGPLPDELPVGIRHEAVQIVSESLSNVVKHAQATATRVVIETDGDELVVSVTDNGRGLVGDPSDRDDEPGGSDAGGHGLRNMRERAASLKGRFHIGPGPGGGTHIEWRVPLPR